jgi:butyrate kinase
MAERILAVNPGATSTKVGVFLGAERVLEATARHGDHVLSAYRGRPMADQLDFRVDAIHELLRGHGADAAAVDAVVGRGGLLRPVAGGTIRVTPAMLAELRRTPRGEHASNLGALIADRIATGVGCPAFVVDPVSVDEWDDVARVSGLAGLDREPLSHALNSKAVARRYADAEGAAYADLRLVVVHLGSGATVSAHRGGRMVDACNSREEGPFSADRAGSLPVVALIDLALAGGHTRDELVRRVFGEGGLYSYLGTRDLQEALRRVDAGDRLAAAVVEAMLYQVRKEAAAMAAVLDGRVDAVILTGGMLHADRVAAELSERLAWIGPVTVYPGEDELRALAEGALRVLRGVEPARDYPEAAGTGSPTATRP